MFTFDQFPTNSIQAPYINFLQFTVTSAQSSNRFLLTLGPQHSPPRDALTDTLKLLFLLFQLAFQPVIHEPLSNPEFLQNTVNGDIVVNGGTSDGSTERTHQQQGTVITIIFIVI